MSRTGLRFLSSAPVLALIMTVQAQSLETLLAYLKSPNPSTRREAAQKLGERRIRDQFAVEALVVAAAKDEDREVRSEAVKSLGMIKEMSTIPNLIAALGDSDIDVQRMAVKSLVSLYIEEGVDFIINRRTGWNRFNPFLDTDDNEIIEPYMTVDPQIITALGESARGARDVDVRIAAIRALGVLRGREAIPMLVDALTADRDVRVDVLRAFIKIGDQSAGPHLVPFFRDTDRKVRTQAMVAAGLLKYQPAIDPLLSVYGLGPEEEKGSVTSVARKIKGSIQYLPPRDEGALWALSLFGDEKAEQIFVENMTDKNVDRRRYAIEGLARIADPRYRDQISRLVLTEGNAQVKLAEHWALYRFGDQDELGNVVKELDDRDEQARSYLLEIDKPEHLYPYLRSSNRTVRLAVIGILGSIGASDAVKELEPIVKASGARTADEATVAIKRIEWRLSGRPNAQDQVLQRETRPRRIGNQ